MPIVHRQEQLPVAEARAGDPLAWDALFARYQMSLYVYLVELVHDEQTSLDLVRETFVNAARHIDQLRDETKFGSWLFGIAHQKVIQHWRRHRPDTRLDEGSWAESPPTKANSSASVLPLDGKGECMRQLSCLSEEHRAVWLLYLLEEFSIEEIAVITGAHTGIVKSRMHYARRALGKPVDGEAP
jgi:RNA polymerase sigma-70 factor (ECF subfamily)